MFRSTLDDVNNRLKTKYLNKTDYSHEQYKTSDWLIERFRPNLVVEGPHKAYSEDKIAIITLGTVTLSFAAKCNRCSIVCIDKVQLLKVEEFLELLSTYRKEKGSCLLKGSTSNQSLQEGQYMTITMQK